MNAVELIREIIRHSVKGDAALDIKTKGSRCEIRNGKVIYTVKEIVIELQVPKPK